MTHLGALLPGHGLASGQGQVKTSLAGHRVTHSLGHSEASLLGHGAALLGDDDSDGHDGDDLYLGGDSPGGGGALLDRDINTNLNISIMILADKVKADL